MTEKELEELGCRKIVWNGTIPEYWLSLGIEDDDHMARLGVRFGEYKDEPFTVWLVLPSSMRCLAHITTIDQYRQLYTLLTGKQK